jgi:hypothetical protein
MTMQPHPVDERDAAWIREAVQFSAAIFANREHQVVYTDSLASAGAGALLFEREATNGRQALVYAITERGHAAMVPRDQWMRAVGYALAS